MLARLPFRHDRIGLVALTGVAPAQATGPPPSEDGVSAVPPQRDWSLRDGSNVQPSACRADALPVELRREMAPGQGFKPRFAASGAAVLSLDDPGMLAPPGGYDPPAFRFEAGCSVRLS